MFCLIYECAQAYQGPETNWCHVSISTADKCRADRLPMHEGKYRSAS